MGWFTRKQPKAADDVLVERTLAFAQEVAQEKPEDEQALLDLIDGIKMMPAKPAPAAVEIAPTPLPAEPIEEAAAEAPQPSASLSSASLPSLLLLPRALTTVAEKPVTVPLPTLPMTIETPPAPPLPGPVLRPAIAEPVRAVPAKSHATPPRQSDMRREIAQRVQNFKAHQQRLNDEREERIKKIYADMQAHLAKSGAQKSPPVS